MPVERSAGAIIFRETKKGREYLLLRHNDTERRGKTAPGHWDFPKGHVEKGEKTEDTVQREVREETGIVNVALIPGFKETIRYFVNYKEEKRLKFVAFFLAAAKRRKVAISFEHQGFAWLPYEEAYKKITYKNSKDALNKANQFLIKIKYGDRHYS